MLHPGICSTCNCRLISFNRALFDFCRARELAARHHENDAKITALCYGAIMLPKQSHKRHWRIFSVGILISLFTAMWLSPALAQYHLERISPVLNQPTFLTQAPGDPPTILYYSTRISTANSGFSVVNTMGKIWRFDTTTRISTSVLDLSARQVFNDDGLQTFAFHPDFNLPGSNGYGKLYVSSSQYAGGLPTNRVEEYILNPTNPAAGAAFSRLILQYNNNAQNNHTVGWIGFDPNATGAARNYLYIGAADASYGNAYNGGISPAGRPSQNPADVRGKILRVDISGGDDYPADPLKNFAIPPSNPVPTYNAANPGTPLTGSNTSGATPALGEVYVTGVRNPYRISFDRVNGDMYWGDVGENAYEEVDFLKAGGNVSGPPVDYGWPQLEADHNSPISGAPHTTTNPFTGVTSLYPLQEWPHGAAGNAAIGGYVYRGPIPELQGKYFYADFVTGKVWMLDFDRNTDPSTFHGTNGVLTDLTALWSTKIIDRAVTNYAGDTNLNTINGLDHIVSFGEDNLGNLYLVDFGYGSSFNGQYTANGGEIFEVVPDPTLNWANLGSGVRFSWTGNYKLQAETNSMGANWFDYPGGTNSPVTVPFDGAQSTVLFRLVWPQ
jgi:glucose/arabinose dehydrogenase